MADYWKSQDKKYCDFCKCWIADNKPSVQFHENGRKHKDAVARKLRTMTRQSVKQHKANVKLEAEMHRMEEAAMKAYLKDMQENPDATSLKLVDELRDRGQIPIQPPSLESSTLPAHQVNAQLLTGKKKKSKIPWFEAESTEGLKYYWNIITNETVWQPPDGGFVTLAEQARTEEKKRTFENIKAKEQDREDRAAQAREEMRIKYMKKADPKDDDPPHSTSSTAPSEESCKIDEDGTPMPDAPYMASTSILAPGKLDPYGGWKTVKIEPRKINLQLPKQEYIEIKVPAVSEPRVKIKEKTVTSLGDHHDDIPTIFKKRKFNRQNMRRKMDDDGQSSD